MWDGINIFEFDFSDLIITKNSSGLPEINIPASSDLGTTVNNASPTVSIPLKLTHASFNSSKRPLLTLDLGYGPYTITRYNGTGKTRLSMEFKEQGKRHSDRDTLYFNAYTEDLFHWDNDLDNDAQRILTINSDSKFFDGFKQLALEEKIFSYLERYADFDFKIDYENWAISFSKGDNEHIKVSRGEENIFVWCIFLAICELTFDDSTAYDWVKYIYIDDPISSLDDNNAIAVASDLAKLLKKGINIDNENDKIKTVLSSHHSLFFNVMCNELKNMRHKQYFLHSSEGSDVYSLRATDDTPYFHHVALLSELQQASESNQIYTHHFNALRIIL